ncbi:MAG: undecaprenyl-diphosphatase UppP [Minisyncoccia bacterium]
MTILDAGILGLVEGITEFLPISSTGHLILASSILGLPATEFLKSFEIAIQLGAIAAVVLLYWRSFLSLTILKKLVVGFIPTGIIGLLLYRVVKTYLLGNELVVVAALFVGGVFLIAFELLHKENEAGAASISDISYRQSFFIGLCQACAIVPGVSRSAATIAGGLLLGIRRTAIVEFSFLLAVPTMLAATSFDLLKHGSSFSTSDIGSLAAGFVVSFVVAMGAIRLLLQYVRRHSFIPFGVYRIAIATLFFVYFFVLA